MCKVLTVSRASFYAWSIRQESQRKRVDNGPELISQRLLEWAEDNGVTINHIQPGKPAQNGYIERFNRTYREDVLDQYWFSDLDEVRDITSEWMDMYNGQRHIHL